MNPLFQFKQNYRKITFFFFFSFLDDIDKIFAENLIKDQFWAIRFYDLDWMKQASKRKLIRNLKSSHLYQEKLLPPIILKLLDAQTFIECNPSKTYNLPTKMNKERKFRTLWFLIPNSKKQHVMNLRNWSPETKGTSTAVVGVKIRRRRKVLILQQRGNAEAK